MKGGFDDPDDLQNGTLSNYLFISMLQQRVQFSCTELQKQAPQTPDSLAMICFPTKVYEFLRSSARDRPETQIFKLLLKLFAEDCKVDYTKAELKEALRQYQPNYLT